MEGGRAAGSVAPASRSAVPIGLPTVPALPRQPGRPTMPAAPSKPNKPAGPTTLPELKLTSVKRPRTARRGRAQDVAAALAPTRRRQNRRRRLRRSSTVPFLRVKTPPPPFGALAGATGVTEEMASETTERRVAAPVPSPRARRDAASWRSGAAAYYLTAPASRRSGAVDRARLTAIVARST